MRLAPIHRNALPHTTTVFNEIGKGQQLVVVVIRRVNYADSNSFNFKMAGINTANAFRVVIDCVNSDFGGRVFVPLLDWKRLTEEEQLDGTRFTLYRDMWMFRGEHEQYPTGGIVAKADMVASKFEALGIRLHRTNLFDMAGLDKPHNIQLAGQ